MPILPGSTIAIFGGGQLGRMLAMAAREMGYHLRVIDPDPGCAARFSVEEHIVASFDDVEAAAWLAKRCNVATLEIEKVSTDCLDRAAAFVPVRPSSGALAIIQDRGAQKTFLKKAGVPVGPFEIATSAEELERALVSLAGPCFVKAARGGYDGRGQVQTQASEEAAAAWRDLAAESCVAERALDIEAELSVMVARSPSGSVAVYPPALNHHESRVLAWSVLPAPISEDLAARATDIARTIATALEIEGLLCVELFLVKGDLLVNELAPRPHNSYHASAIACSTSQFEQCVRAICDLPLGSTEVLRPAAIYNLLGDDWSGQSQPAFGRALELPGVRLHLYGKSVARPGRKMGHLSASAHTAMDAVALVRAAKARLK
ncbi:MAG: 5-(carboxyamino)imidazole ribonucleotide synthase [Polyangiaceae bacterium]|nr:5-(carboxyamino)imidazole ribonucleotide synthase [Polyangiaceae bacterium]